jgi:hypothetical protein
MAMSSCVTIEKMLEMVFSKWSVLRCYNRDKFKVSCKGVYEEKIRSLV